MGVDKSLPPATKVHFRLEKQTDPFFLMVGMSNATVPIKDNEKYCFFIDECKLYVQIGTLNVLLYKEIERRWPSEDILYFFRRFSILEQQIGIGKAAFTSNQLWSESINPLRIYFFIVKSVAIDPPGDYGSNPVF